MTALWLGGCASYGGWEPTVDPRAGTNQETLNRDLSECKELASKVVGAAAGAVIGAVGGHAGSGAALGAAVGGTGAGVHQGVGAEQQYKRSYIKCLEGRGHRVIN
jgi:hypothetical protein